MQITLTLPKSTIGLEPRVPGRILKNVEAPAPSVDDDDDPFKDLREVGEYSGGVSSTANIDQEDDVDVVVDVGACPSGGFIPNNQDEDAEDVCTICGKGDDLMSEDYSSDEDDVDAERTIEFDWIHCEICKRHYHNHCLESSIGGSGNCIYCGWE